jgi:hypothetical protein
MYRLAQNDRDLRWISSHNHPVAHNEGIFGIVWAGSRIVTTQLPITNGFGFIY